MNPKYHLLVATAALSLGACSTDDTCTGPEIGGYKISFTVAEEPETRTTLDAGDILRWVPTDRVGIYTVGQQNVNSNALTAADVNQSPVEFIGVLENLVSNGDMFYAYYPYDKEQSTDPAAVKLTIPAEQTQTKAGEYNGQSHPLVALPKMFEWEKDSYACRISSVRFRLLGAIVELKLFSSDEALRGEKIQSVTFVSENPLAGDFTFDLTGVTVDKEPRIAGYELKEVTTTLAESAAIPATKDEAALVYLTIAPGAYTGQIVVKTDAAQYTFRLKNTMTFGRAVIKGLPADLAKAERELPYTETDPIQFEDATVKEICVANWDTNNDGELSYKEAAAVTDLKGVFKYKGITSFNELRYFTGLQSIGDSAFRGCSSLTSIHIPDGVTTIEWYAFDGCSSLTSIHIPDGVTAIGGSAFQYCSSLTSINIPNRVTTIEDRAFYGCSSLTSITIPQTVSSSGEGAFARCTSLSAFEGKYASADHRCLIRNGVLLAFAPAGLTEYTIPDGVTAIGSDAFDGCSSLTSINIPDGVATIGRYAFANCSSLTSINIPDGVTSIGWNVFQGCRNLASINIPTGVTAIGNSAFENCSSLTSINIPDKVTEIGPFAFFGCSSLTSIDIPDGVTAIESVAFYGCSSLTSVYCKPTTPPTLGSGAFQETSSSLKIYVPTASVEAYKTAEGWSEHASQIFADNNQPEADENDPIHFEDSTVKRICTDNWDTSGDGELSYKEAAAVTDLKEVFRQNSYITSFNELQYFTGLQLIGRSAFDGCSRLTSINIPDGVTTIDTSAFSGCSRLTSINIPDGVTEIGWSAFSGCSRLTSINIPQTVKSIDKRAFIQCSSLSAFYGNYASADHRCLIRDGVLLAFAPAGLTGYTIPAGVAEIGSSAFEGCSSLTNIDIPAGVTTIGNGAFRRCSSLTDINIPAGVTAIGGSAFYGCSSLTSISIPDGVTTIEKSAFQGCSSLTSINIPDGVTKIGSSAFKGCSSLTSIHIPDGMTSIGSDAFHGCSSLTSISIPDGVTMIESHAFGGCSSLTSIHIPAGVTAIRNSAFQDCSSLTSINIPDGVATIGRYAFANCSSLTSINIPDGVTSIGWNVFQGCRNLASINIPTGVTAIGNSAFENCSSLTSINIPDKVTEIGPFAFYGCSSLTSIDIPDGVTTIKNMAFYYCSSLTSVYCKPTTPPTLGSGAFQETSSSLKIYVPTASVEAYKTAEGWSDYASKIVEENN